MSREFESFHPLPRSLGGGYGGYRVESVNLQTGLQTCPQFPRKSTVALSTLRWAQANGYPIAAAEVSLPNFRFRLDAAAYRPGRMHKVQQDLKTGRTRRVPVAAVGLTAILNARRRGPTTCAPAAPVER